MGTEIRSLVYKIMQGKDVKSVFEAKWHSSRMHPLKYTWQHVDRIQKVQKVNDMWQLLLLKFSSQGQLSLSSLWALWVNVPRLYCRCVNIVSYTSTLSFFFIPVKYKHIYCPIHFNTVILLPVTIFFLFFKPLATTFYSLLCVFDYFSPYVSDILQYLSFCV